MVLQALHLYNCRSVVLSGTTDKDIYKSVVLSGGSTNTNTYTNVALIVSTNTNTYKTDQWSYQVPLTPILSRP